MRLPENLCNNLSFVIIIVFWLILSESRIVLHTIFSGIREWRAYCSPTPTPYPIPIVDWMENDDVSDKTIVQSEHSVSLHDDTLRSTRPMVINRVCSSIHHNACVFQSPAVGALPCHWIALRGDAGIRFSPINKSIRAVPVVPEDQGTSPDCQSAFGHYAADTLTFLIIIRFECV